jgi:hypothetical protein
MKKMMMIVSARGFVAARAALLGLIVSTSIAASGCGSRGDMSQCDMSQRDISGRSPSANISATAPLATPAAVVGSAAEPAAGMASKVSLRPAGSMRLINGAASPDALIREALDALAASDTARLQRLLVTRDEFQNHIYPELGIHYPAANDMRPETRRFIWENQFMGSTKGLERALRDLGGKHMELLGVSYNEGGMKYASYSIYEGTRAHVRMDDGREALLHVFGSVVEMDGVYKLLTYRERD